jgi:type IV pilus assembly protein PilN
MIRVNLLAADRPTQKSKKSSSASPSLPSAPGTVQLYLFLVVFVGGALAACTFGYFYITGQISKVNKEIVEKQDRLAKLQQIKKQVDEFQAKKKMLEDKIALIERLKADQSGPVHLLDELSKALPDFVWLTEMSQTGNTLAIKGNTNSITSVADFITNLQRSGWFQVELRSTVEQQGLVQFELAATFTDPTAAAKQAAAAAAAAAAAPAAPAAPKK